MVTWAMFTVFAGWSIFSQHSCAINSPEFDESKTIPFGSSRARRHLLFPSTSVLQLTIGVSAAFDFVGDQSGQISYAFQQNVALPSNFSELLELQTLRMKRDVNVYDHLQDLFDRSYSNGSECLKKTICQLAETPLEGGLLEEVLNFVFGPSNHGFNDGADEDPFSHAESVGQRTGDCHSAFPYCPETPLDLISQLTEDTNTCDLRK